MKRTLLIFAGILLLCGISSANPVCTPAPLQTDITISAATNFPTGTSDTFTVTLHLTGCIAANTAGAAKICIYQEAHSEMLIAPCQNLSIQSTSSTPLSVDVKISTSFATKKLDKSKPTSYVTAYLFPDSSNVFAPSATQHGAPIWY